MAEELHVSTRAEWRNWLSRNHDNKKEVWLIYSKKHTGRPTIPYDDSVEEALCFGWVDSIIKKLDEEKFARKFTSRTKKSRWSQANKERAEKMIREGKMTEVGLAMVREAKANGKWFEPSPVARYKKRLAIPSYVKEALTANERALGNFSKLAESYKRNFVAWIDSAKKEETRRKRLAEAIGLLERDQKLGMK